MLEYRPSEGKVLDYGSGAMVSHTKGRSPWPFRRHRYAYRLRHRLRNSTESLNEAVQRVHLLAERCGGSEEELADLDIALREALANAMFHGNASADDKSVSFRCYAAPGEGLLIVVEDQGVGFDPEQVPDPRESAGQGLSHGRGLLLMRELLDHIEYRKNGTTVVLYKTFSAED